MSTSPVSASSTSRPHDECSKYDPSMGWRTSGGMPASPERSESGGVETSLPAPSTPAAAGGRQAGERHDDEEPTDAWRATHGANGIRRHPPAGERRQGAPAVPMLMEAPRHARGD